MSSKENERVNFYVDLITKNITGGSLIATVKQIAQVKNQSAQVVRNNVSAGTLPIVTFKDAGRRVCTVLALAEWLAGRDASPPAKPTRGRPSKASKLEGRA